MLRIYGAALLGLYLGFVTIRSLQTGVFRYKGRSHDKAEEPKTFWFGVAWFGVLTVVMFGYAVMEFLRERA